MKVFVWEYVCGGGWPKGLLTRSLATEGGAMLCALCSDLARLPGVEVTTTLDARCRLAVSPDMTVIPVESPDRGHEELLHQSLIADATFVIAPELDNILTRRVRELREAGASVVALPDGWLELCSDKRTLSLFDVPMIPTYPLEQAEPHPLESDLAVIKPAFGAGSQTISVLPTRQTERLRTPQKTPPLQQLIVQPFIPGTAVSLGSIVNSVGQRTIFPVAQQVLSEDGHLQYRGGIIPWQGPAVEPLRQIVRRCLDRISDPVGYIGFDFVVPEADPDRPLLVEINPRLCTSYLGYRRLTDDNLAALMLPNWPKSEIRWKSQSVSFSPDGRFQLMPSQGEFTCE